MSLCNGYVCITAYSNYVLTDSCNFGISSSVPSFSTVTLAVLLVASDDVSSGRTLTPSSRSLVTDSAWGLSLSKSSRLSCSVTWTVYNPLF